MIISVSRRSDIPLFYSDWFVNRIKAGFVHVRNPMNHNQVSRISLLPEDVECFVLWTKGLTHIDKVIEAMKSYDYYVQVSITAYDNSFEPNIAHRNLVINDFIDLSIKIGRKRCVWRYDPIIINEAFTVNDHIRIFKEMAGRLKGYTDTCVISFVEPYRKIKKVLQSLKVVELSTLDKRKMIETFSILSKACGMKLSMCSFDFDRSIDNVYKGSCISEERIKKVTGLSGSVKKDQHQRENCACISSVDIGAYNSCPGGCVYCYANHGLSSKSHFKTHDTKGTLLFGHLSGSEKITNRKVIKHFTNQLSLF